MATEHNVLTDPEIHEPKGASTASADQVYVADGSGSGAWQALTADELNLSSIKNLNKITLNIDIEDLSTASSFYVVSPIAGVISEFYSTIDQAIATADTTLTLEIAGTAVTDGALTIGFTGSAVGDVDNVSPSAANAVTAGQAIEIVCNGGTSTSGARAHLTLLIDVT